MGGRCGLGGEVGLAGGGGDVGGGWSGPPGGAGPATLADGFANPLTASALVSSREATVDPRDHDTFDLPDPTALPRNAQRWEPWVRSSVLLQALVEGLRVRANGQDCWVDYWDLTTGVATGLLIAKLTAPSVDKFREQVPLVLSWAELREERIAEILAQIDNQTPFFSAVPYIHPTRTPRTLELLGVAMQLAVSIEMRVKHELACWRPVEYSPLVQPMITTPGHGSLPSGHATQAYMLAHVLQTLLGLEGQPHHATVRQLQRQAARIATNRVIAGVHFPVDSIAGRLLGVALGEFFVARCCPAPQVTWRPRGFDGSKAFREFLPNEELDGSTAPAYYRRGPPVPAAWTKPEVLTEAWARAAAEWEGKAGLKLAALATGGAAT